MPMNRKMYPSDWKEISKRIRFERARGGCEQCGVMNGAVGIRDKTGRWYSADDVATLGCENEHELFGRNKVITIVLTVAHLDHDTTNNADENLKALCQRCHLRHDAKHHARNAMKTRQSKRGQLELVAL